MYSKFSQNDANVIIIGAGLSGLTTAFYILRREPTLSVMIFEGNGTTLESPFSAFRQHLPCRPHRRSHKIRTTGRAEQRRRRQQHRRVPRVLGLGFRRPVLPKNPDPDHRLAERPEHPVRGSQSAGQRAHGGHLRQERLQHVHHEASVVRQRRAELRAVHLLRRSNFRFCQCILLEHCVDFSWKRWPRPSTTTTCISTRCRTWTTPTWRSTWRRSCSSSSTRII